MSPTDRFWFLFSAYAAIWVLLALFLFRLGRRHRVMSRELEELRVRLGTAAAQSDRGAASRE